MNSRIEKYHYDEKDKELPSRVEKNKSFYNNIEGFELSKIKPNSNVKILETSQKTIDIDKIRKYIEENSEELPKRKNIVVREEQSFEQKKNESEEKRIYDINSVLEKAKEGRETFYEDEKFKKLRDTQYDILSKIQMYEEKKYEKEEEPKFNTDERTLIDLINTVAVNKKSEELLNELKSEDNTVVTAPIEEENKDEFLKKAIEEYTSNTQKEIVTSNTSVINKNKDDIQDVKNLDRSFYTNSMSFSKEDFEGFEELEKTVKKNNVLVKVVVIILIAIAIITIFIVLKYILNIF